MVKDIESVVSDKGAAGEEFVNQLAYTSFMKYWCYPNPMDINGDKKEICDLIVYFNDILVLFCVKNYDFKGKYSRYIKHTIEKDIRQLCGAERKIRQSNNGIIIVHPDRAGETLVDMQNIKETHLITIHFGGDDVKFHPACDTYNGRFIHVFNNLDFNMLMSEVDTISDFIGYLKARQELFINRNVIILPSSKEFTYEDSSQLLTYSIDKVENFVIISGSEMDLVAKYLMSNRSFSKLEIDNNTNGSLFDIDGAWDFFNTKDEVQKRDEANKVSYFIDNFVRDQIEIGGENIRVAKFLLSFNRFDRRCIAEAFFDFVKMYNHSKMSEVSMGRRYWDFNGNAFVFSYIDPPRCNTDEYISLVTDSYILHYDYKMKSVFTFATVEDMKEIKFGLVTDLTRMSISREQQVNDMVQLAGWFQNEEEGHQKK